MEQIRQKLSAWKALVIEVGLFILFLASFGEYIIRKVAAVVWPLVK
jgi:hypothetical protein